MRLFGIFILVILLASCEKIIDVKINDSEPQIVIEGVMNTDTSIYSVFIKTTVPYNSTSNSFIDNATVTLSDDFGFSEVLSFVGNGEYQTSNIAGVVGRTYTVSVDHEGVNYQNYSKINSPVAIDSINLYFVPENTIPGVDEGNYLRIYFTDPVGIGNKQRLIFIKNDTVYNGPDDYHLYNDNFDDGLQEVSVYFDYKLNSGDKVKVELWTIDDHVHEYYTTLENIISQGFAPSGVPDNPNSIWTNGALGFYNAYSFDSDSLIVP
jgi:hypothetical protein